MCLFRCRNFDRKFFKYWLLRERPQDRDIKLLQKLKDIKVQSAMKSHDSSKKRVPSVSSSTMKGPTIKTAIALDNNLQFENNRENISEHLAS